MTITLFDRLGEQLEKERPGNLPKERTVRFDRFGQGDPRCAVSPDGGWLAVVELENWIRVFDIRSGQTRWCAQHHQDSVLRLAWSPDGQTLCASSEEGHVTLMQASRGTVIWSFHVGDWAQGLAFSNDGEWIAIGTHAEALFVLSVATGEERWRAHLGCAVYSAAWSADGEYVAAAGEYNLLAVTRTSDGGVVWQLPSDRQFYTWDTVRWHPTSPRLAALRYNGSELLVFDVRTELQMLYVSATDVEMADVEWVTEGHRLCVTLDTGGSLQYLLPPLAQQPSTIAPVPLPAAHPVVTYTEASELLKIDRPDDSTLLLARFGEVIRVCSTRPHPEVIQPADILTATPGAGDQFVWRETSATGEVRWHPFSAFWKGSRPD